MGSEDELNYRLCKIAIERAEPYTMFGMDKRGIWHEINRLLELHDGKVIPTSENPSKRFAPSFMCLAVHRKIKEGTLPFEIEVNKDLILPAFTALVHAFIPVIFYFDETETDDIWLKKTPIITHAGFNTETDAIIGVGLFTVSEHENQG